MPSLCGESRELMNRMEHLLCEASQLSWLSHLVAFPKLFDCDPMLLPNLRIQAASYAIYLEARFSKETPK